MSFPNLRMNPPNVSPIQPTSRPRVQVSNPSQDDRVVLLARQNNKNKYLVPSTHNTFNGYNVERVMIDSGCNSNLIYLKEHDVEHLVQYFPHPYSWEVTTHGGVGGSYLVLKIKGATHVRFMTDATDYISDDDGQEGIYPYPHPFEFTFSEVNFHLSDDDITYLAQSNIEILDKSSLLTDQHRHQQARRDHALIGQLMLKYCACLQVDGNMMVMTKDAYHAGTHDIRQLIRMYSHHIPVLPTEMADEDISIDESDRSIDPFIENV